MQMERSQTDALEAGSKTPPAEAAWSREGMGRAGATTTCAMNSGS